MFDPNVLSRMVDLQEKSYLLLKWVNQSLRRGTLDFKYIHNAMDVAEASEEWIARHFDNIPLKARPKKHEIKEFARLFSSYLTTSFELIETPGKRLVSTCGCYWCGYLVSANHLKTRKITQKTRESALQLKHLYLELLAEEAALALLPLELEGLLREPGLSANISLAAYANELIRRSKFASQGEGVLVLWREIAWEENKPKKDFYLLASDIIASEEVILDRMMKI